MGDPIAELPGKEQVKLLTISRDPDVEEPCMF